MWLQTSCRLLTFFHKRHTVTEKVGALRKITGILRKSSSKDLIRKMTQKGDERKSNSTTGD